MCLDDLIASNKGFPATPLSDSYNIPVMVSNDLIPPKYAGKQIGKFVQVVGLLWYSLSTVIFLNIRYQFDSKKLQYYTSLIRMHLVSPGSFLEVSVCPYHTRHCMQQQVQRGGGGGACCIYL